MTVLAIAFAAWYAWHLLEVLLAGTGKPDVHRIAFGAYPVLRAVRAFKVRTGLWPQYLADIGGSKADVFEGAWKEFLDYSTCRLSSKWAEARWAYKWEWGNGFHFLHYVVRNPPVEFMLLDTGSSLHMHTEPGDFGCDLTLPYGFGDGSIDAVVAELSRRIEREPARILHYCGLVTHLVRADRTAEALKVCESCEQVLPEACWPRLAALDIRRRAGMPYSAAAFADWARSQPHVVEILGRGPGSLGEKGWKRYAWGCGEYDVSSRGFVTAWCLWSAGRFRDALAALTPADHYSFLGVRATTYEIRTQRWLPRVAPPAVYALRARCLLDLGEREAALKEIAEMKKDIGEIPAPIAPCRDEWGGYAMGVAEKIDSGDAQDPSDLASMLPGLDLYMEYH